MTDRKLSTTPQRPDVRIQHGCAAHFPAEVLILRQIGAVCPIGIEKPTHRLRRFPEIIGEKVVYERLGVELAVPLQFGGQIRFQHIPVGGAALLVELCLVEHVFGIVLDGKPRIVDDCVKRIHRQQIIVEASRVGPQVRRIRQRAPLIQRFGIRAVDGRGQ